MTPWSFYIHCVAAVAILWADYTDTLEPTFNKFEQSIGLYTPSIDSLDTTPPFYIPPVEMDSTWYLPPIEESIPDSNFAKIIK